jgi:hypothetical protein
MCPFATWEITVPCGSEAWVHDVLKATRDEFVVEADGTFRPLVDTFSVGVGGV